MSRIGERFQALREAGRTALVPYLTAGDPDPAATVPLMHRLVEAGADLLELGVPFSDPMADGPVIQAACERALAHGVRLRDVLDMVARFRERDAETPVVLMGYLNPVEAMGYAAFAERAAAAGVDGVLTVDLPPEEAGELVAELRPRGLDPVFLAAPTTSEERARGIARQAGGFLYYVSLKGVTGAGHLDLGDAARRVEALRRVVSLPVGVGFGIRNPEAAARVARVADAVVVGSALVERLAREGEEAAVGWLASLRAAVDEADAQAAAGGSP